MCNLRAGFEWLVRILLPRHLCECLSARYDVFGRTINSREFKHVQFCQGKRRDWARADCDVRLQPLMPVIEMPSMNVFWARKKRTMIGRATSVLAAIR